MLKKIPDWLYEPLPYLYALMGLIATIVLDVPIGKVSGLLLISAGFVIWNLRFTYRKRRRRPEPMDLSWGANQRKNPPKGLDESEKQQREAAMQARQAAANKDEEDF